MGPPSTDGMTLEADSGLGPYRIVKSIGAGGMGEVYRARDPRLGRDVAVKVLPAVVAGDSDRLRRFEQEARAAGALNHPNVLAVYDVGVHEGTPYVVSELLEGETLRERLGAGALPSQKAIDHAIQIARGLAAAHDKGIVHRDLKPENVFVTKDGRVKILDFGLAKLSRREVVSPNGPMAASSRETETATTPGTVLGTVGYMSPEQVRGHPADHRSDIFSVGVILFEMLVGRRAFRSQSAAETMAAIVRDDPLESAAPDRALTAGLARTLRHCLEKSPEERFQSARDLAFDLETLSGLTGPATALATTRPARRWRLTAAVLGLVAGAASGVFLGKGVWREPPLSFNQLTFRQGWVTSARFAPDGDTIVYSGAWEGNPPELFSTRAEGRGALSLGVRGARILSISRGGEMAILLMPAGGWMGGPGASTGGNDPGTLARVPLAGGVPREIAEDVLDADWAPDGKELAVVRVAEGKYRVEFPIGTVLYESANLIPTVRLSPREDRLAFFEAVSMTGGLSGNFLVAVVDRAGKRKPLSSGRFPTGLAWSPSGREIWFGAFSGRGSTALRALSESGSDRLVTRLAGYVHLCDVFRDGRTLLAEENGRHLMFARVSDAEKERNLSWAADTTATDLSADGRTLLFTEADFGEERNYGVYLRGTDGSPAVRLGSGYGYGLSPDGRWVLALEFSRPHLEFVLLPTRAGAPIRIPSDLPLEFHGAAWLPHSQGFVFSGSAPDEGARLYRQDIRGRKPEPITRAEDDLRAPVVSRDGRWAAAVDSGGLIARCPLDGGEPAPLRGAEPGEVPIQWSADGRSVYVYRPDQRPVQVFELDVARGSRRLWKRIEMHDPTGLDGNVVVLMTPDARTYAYSFFRMASELYLVEGLR